MATSSPSGSTSGAGGCPTGRRRLRTARCLTAALLVLGGLAVGGCAGPGTAPGAQPPAAGSARPDTSGADPTQSVPAAREGRPGPTARIRFVPTRVVLPGGSEAPVAPAETVDGELKVPEDVAHVGWWDGSAAAGDPFGHTVIAGHVDSATEGLGYFARLLRIKPGEVVTVTGAGHRLSYRVISVRTITKQTLATSGSIFDQTGDPRLVLITCGGTYRRGTGYDSNVVVMAEPLGPAH